jgi:hypothetical protein
MYNLDVKILTVGNLKVLQIPNVDLDQESKITRIGGPSVEDSGRRS